MDGGFDEGAETAFMVVVVGDEGGVLLARASVNDGLDVDPDDKEASECQGSTHGRGAAAYVHGAVSVEGWGAHMARGRKRAWCSKEGQQGWCETRSYGGLTGPRLPGSASPLPKSGVCGRGRNCAHPSGRCTCGRISPSWREGMHASFPHAAPPLQWAKGVPLVMDCRFQLRTEL